MQNGFSFYFDSLPTAQLNFHIKKKVIGYCGILYIN